MKKKLSQIILFFSLFMLLSLPVVWQKIVSSQVLVEVQFPKDSRTIASVKSKKSSQCQTKKRWRLRCTMDIKGQQICLKDQIQTYQDCSTSQL